MFVKSAQKKILWQASVLVAPLLLVGCSSVPDAANPVEWYRSTVEYFDDDEVAQAQPMSFETDGEISQAAPPVVKKEVASGFKAAETPQRQYAQAIKRQGDVVNALGNAQTVQGNQPPAPMAAPVTPVAQIPLVAPRAVEQAVAPQKQQLAMKPVQTGAVPVVNDQRSVSEVYADNINQTRPLSADVGMRGTSNYDMGNYAFETVVVSSGGVKRQAQKYSQNTSSNRGFRQTQIASRGNVQRDTYSSSMVIEPSVVSQGFAQSLSRYNASSFSGSFQVATIQFGNGSANLTGEDLRILKEVLSIHRQQGGVIRIVGHASSRTRNMEPSAHEKVNHKVSLGRADKVARELLRLGMAGDRLFVGGVADSEPLYQEVMPSGEAGNRRTEIFVDY